MTFREGDDKSHTFPLSHFSASSTLRNPTPTNLSQEPSTQREKGTKCVGPRARARADERDGWEDGVSEPVRVRSGFVATDKQQSPPGIQLHTAADTVPGHDYSSQGQREKFCLATTVECRGEAKKFLYSTLSSSIRYTVAQRC